MKKKFLVGTVFVLGALTSHLAAAATTADLTLAGQLVPSSCDITINGGNSYLLDDIHRSTLSPEGTETNFSEDTTKSLSIICSGATLVGVTSGDNRPGTSNSATIYGHGLGRDPNGNQIGHYNLAFEGATVDGAAAETIVSTDNGVSWNIGTRVLRSDRTNVISVKSLGGANDPIAFTNATIPVKFLLRIADKATLAATQSVKLDGSTTLELYYM